jgi:hypothetical protein
MESRKRADTDPSRSPRTAPDFGEPGEPRGVQPDIADADKEARSGQRHEEVRNTPPAGSWNDTSAD